MAATYLRELQQNLIERFNWSEIEDLCLRLNVDHEIAPGTEKSRWLRGLLCALGRDGRLPELVVLAQEERPNVTWPTVPGDFQMPTSLDPMRSPVEELRDYLARAVAAYEARIVRAVYQSSQQPEEPYKSLYAFDIEDANIFFGRKGTAESMYETVLEDRLTVVYARSGAGKTSLLNAGLTPRLIADGRLPVFARTYHDPVYALKQAVAPKSGGLWPSVLAELSLHEFLAVVCQNLSRNSEELVVVLDQFEEFFIFWPEADRNDFVNALADCYEDKSLPVRFVIALRKDYYADMDAFEKRIPRIFDTRFGLKAMSRDEARLAITEPVGRLKQDVTYEQRLLDALLDDLASGEIELPHLQLVCTQLFESLPAERDQILLVDYKGFGRTAGVLGRYLQKTLDDLPAKQAVIAKDILKALVSSESTKRVLSNADLAARFGNSDTMLNTVLAKLINARILRRDEIAGNILYEMAHEVLIEEIRGWFDESDLRRKQAEELLTREVANWRIYGTLIPKDRLELLYEHREALAEISSEVAVCLLQSALAANYQIEDWATIAANINDSQLREVLQNGRSQTVQAVFRGLGTAWQIRQLVELGDENSDVRKRAATSLGLLGDKRAVEPLIAALRDEHDAVREAATGALEQLGEPAIEPLIAVLQDEEKDVRQAAAEVLGQSGDERAVEPLIATLKDENEGVRSIVAGALRQLGEAAVEPLIVALKDENESVRQAAARVLGQSGDKRAVGPLIAALQDENVFVRQRAAEALRELGDDRAVVPLIAAFKDKDRDVREAAALAIGELGDKRAVEPLIAALTDDDLFWEAMLALEVLGEPAFEPLIASLQDEDGDVREGAARALGQFDNERAVEPLIAALQDEYRYVRIGAARALGQLGDERAVEPLIAAFKDEARYVRMGAAEALGQLGEHAIELLIDALQDKDGDVREGATIALGQLGEPAIEPLIAALKDEDSNIRAEAAEALGQLGNKRAIEPLIAALKDEDRYVREAATWALGHLGEPAIEPLIDALKDKDSDVREAAATALGQLGNERAVDPLIAVLKDEVGDLRGKAARILGQLGNKRAIEPLRIAALKDEDWYVRGRADESLKKLGFRGHANSQ